MGGRGKLVLGGPAGFSAAGLGAALPSVRSRGLSGLELEPGTQSHGHVRARETEDEGRTGVQTGGRKHRVIKCRPSAAWWQWASVRTFAGPAFFPSDWA